jgi:hypothetical protein
MRDRSVTTVWDDGKGRLLPSKEPKKPDTIVLHLKDWHEISEHGDYAFTYELAFGVFECLVLRCPFCNFEQPVPTFTKVTKKNPLNIEEEMYCRNCLTFFHVINGIATRSWIGGFSL